MISIFYMAEICKTLYFSIFGAKSLKWSIMGASTLDRVSKAVMLNCHTTLMC